MAITVTRLNGALGARVDGIDYASGIDAATLATLRDALARHHVLCVEGAPMTPAQHLQIARHFGEPEHHDFYPNLGPGLEHVTVLDSTKGGRADMWHSDEQYLAQPPQFTFTRAIELPPHGGDTAFISLCAAFDALSPRLQQCLDGLQAMHDYAQIIEFAWQVGLVTAAEVGKALQSDRQTLHPLVTVHPPSGRKTLFVSPTYTRFIQDLSFVESKHLLALLFEHVQRPEFQYRHRWQPGDLMIWDNRCTLHYAVNDYDQRRVMHRISVMPPAA
ncbi:MAG: TauD/TfdA family dioxygenase [Spongiibacteraceae bacterium]|jgi:taurine dioxygenase|nr:TauD/TfdA family dioxygenase [Spongiibacteraceae bacterium]